MHERHERRVQRKVVPAVVEIRREDQRAALAGRAFDQRRVAGGESRQRLAGGCRRSAPRSETSTRPRLAGLPANAWNTGWRPSAGASARAAGLAPSTAAICSVDPAPSTSPTTSPSTSGPAAMKQAAAVLRVRRQQLAPAALEPARREQQRPRRAASADPRVQPARSRAADAVDLKRRSPPPCPRPAHAARRTRRGSTSPDAGDDQHRRLAGRRRSPRSGRCPPECRRHRRRVTARATRRAARRRTSRRPTGSAPSDTVASPAGRLSIRQVHARVARRGPGVAHGGDDAIRQRPHRGDRQIRRHRADIGDLGWSCPRAPTRGRRRPSRSPADR